MNDANGRKETAGGGGPCRLCGGLAKPNGTPDPAATEPRPPKPPPFTLGFWLQILGVLVVLGAVAAFVALGGSRGNGALGKGFEYDLSKHSKTDPTLVRCFETNSIPVPLDDPAALALAAGDRLLVAGGQHVVTLDDAGRELARWEVGPAPNCLAAGPDGSVYVGFREHVEVFASNGTRQATWERMGEDAVLTCIAVSGDDVVVADAGNRVAWRFKTSGQLAGRIAEKDRSRGENGLVIPSPYFDVAFAPDGALWIVDPGRHELRHYSLAGERKTSWKRASMTADGFSGCCNPTHIAIRPDGTFVTSEKGFVRVKLYGPAGEFLGFVAGTEQFVEGTRGLDLAVDSRNRILVLDPVRRTVRVFLDLKKTEGATP
jgi:hypothetical protein